MDAHTINILIVEDEQLIALELAAGLERDGYRIAGIADTCEEARGIYSREFIDIVLMDIHIRGKVDGVDTAAELMRIRPVPVVYLSALTDPRTVERVKGTHPAAFLSKPYSMPNVRIAIELALANFAVARGAVLGGGSPGAADGGVHGAGARGDEVQGDGARGDGARGAGAVGDGSQGAGATVVQMGAAGARGESGMGAAGGELGAGSGAESGAGPGAESGAESGGDAKTAGADKEMILQLEDSIFVKNNVQFVKIALQDILYLEADNNYVQLYTPERKFALRVSLAQLLEKIQFKKLVRIHRSYAVNIDRMSSFSDGEVWLGKVSLPLGRNYREDFLNKFYFK